MALARFALRSLQQRLGSSPSPASLVGRNLRERSRPELEGFQRMMATNSGTEKASDDKEVAVSDGGGRRRRFSLFPRRNRRRSLWRDDDRDFVPELYEFFPSGLGNALMQATDNINRLFNSMNISPWQLAGSVKEKDDHYKIRYEVPGLTKDDVKITVHDGVLSIRGEQKKEEEEEADDERWSAASYGYYNTSLVLPEDAKVDEIKAELKDGVLSITVPRTEKPKREVKEVKVH
ncbi:26.5 kDa heat shock protein, mitochondrial [Punica granatum]|uniref:26.5 kDa heat shock protein, mitochondrial n=1 Tax=Punica granatum TaxID=22663 RepID=A0A6P8CZN5_PUNGR|nr:26.5 kDa heat shock protein, mitochondrial [Punica granatum]